MRSQLSFLSLSCIYLILEFGVCWNSWICEFIIFIRFGKLLVIFLFRYFFLSLLCHIFCRDSCLHKILLLEVIPQFTDAWFSFLGFLFFVLFLVHFIWGSFYCCVLKFIGLCCLIWSWIPSSLFFKSDIVVSISVSSAWIFITFFSHCDYALLCFVEYVEYICNSCFNILLADFIICHVCV